MRLGLALFVGVLTLGSQVRASACVPDVAAAFGRVPSSGSDAAIGIDEGFPSGRSYRWLSRSHFQGIQLLQGGAFLAVSGASERAAHLFVAPLEPPGRARMVELDATFRHAGGFQVLDDVLVVGLERENDSKVVFFDVSDPLAPRLLPGPTIRREPPLPPVDHVPTAGAVGIARLPDGRFLLLVGRFHSAVLDFYRSDGADLETSRFERVATWHRDQLGGGEPFGAYQSINLIPQCDGRLFFVGLERVGGSSWLPGGHDEADLFRLRMNAAAASVTHVATRRFTCGPCDFDAGAGVHVDPSGAMRILGVGHWLDGDEIRFREFAQPAM